MQETSEPASPPCPIWSPLLEESFIEATGHFNHQQPSRCLLKAFFAANEHEHEKAMKDWIELILTKNLPLNVVDDPAFRSFSKHSNNTINPSDDLTKPLGWVSHSRHARWLVGHLLANTRNAWQTNGLFWRTNDRPWRELTILGIDRVKLTLFTSVGN